VRNRRVALVGVIVAVLAAIVGIALAVAAITRGSGGSGVGPTPSTSGESVTAVDFCYVEAMIYYRVEAVDLANGAEAEKMYLELLKAQNTAMIAFVNLVLASDPNARVEASVHDVIAQANNDNAQLEQLLAGLT
jgi:hypothetical protein